MRKRAIIFPFLILILVYLIYSYLTKGLIFNISNISPEALTNISSGNLLLAGIIFVLIMIIEVVFAPFHPLLFYIAGGILFGPIIAIILAVLGGIAGGVLAFYIARKWGREYVERKIPKNKREKFDNFSEKHGGWAIFLLRLNPLTSTDIWNYVAGLSKVKFWPYIIGTTLGLIPATAIMIYLGVPIQSSPILFQIFLVAILLYLVLGIVLFLGLKKKKLNKTG